ncbi:tRNA dihydrouridine(20/20a) synthase DusA [Hellea balneolensis]|uniref:tRNA dihydrouridine(20/20a) synthase DusA n=1 Tax=Hellea balneolensis TaxID=287478 RepID=UPI00047D97F7|nr:tRNA dihydrouridine(20/20a) synthase DusA [Hellea balneolensis]
MSFASQHFKVSVAPMMDWTDRHCRWFHRRLSARALLYTEMVVADAIIHGDKDFLIAYNPEEHPVALQIGGSDPVKLAAASKIGEGFGYDEININIGCPSDRVQSGRFGACLMAEPDLVAACYSAMAEAVDVPVTVKCRLGIDDQNLDETLPDFIEKVSAAGASHFIIHARKAWLKGLSPKENRDVPPLDYGLVHAMKARYPHLEICLNGGIKTIAKAKAASAGLDGVMLGRAAYHNPWILTEIDKQFYEEAHFTESRENIVQDLIEYAKRKQDEDRSTKALIRHIMGLYAGQPGARLWRRTLSEGISSGEKPSDIIRLAAKVMAQLKLAA